ncbi:S-methyl-5-thioribose kinase [Neptunomonas concharum]|uniref:S-methyl-5-thioribose kinase n=1 Tax=Neptunomonas concharum TaxID=1031538 RepID=A0A5P1RCX2_9GAMM|nr:S-methyl-5-thioribose kinase [Neptunomonas concharum]QEQ97116.1 S-methyl-5-thioribose kinase [Neptunomonas concharum]
MTTAKFANDAEVIEFARTNTPYFTSGEAPSVEEIGDGNINFVYRVKDSKDSVIVKQALPYVRIIGEGWPLSLDRIRIEASTLKTEGQWAEAYVPKVYCFDEQQSAVIMEDIGDHDNLRHALIARKPLPALGRHLGEFLAETLFHTSDFYLDTYQKKAAVSSNINPDLCKITEELFFWDPFCDHERNAINPAVRPVAEAIWQDEVLKIEAAKLKYHFMTDAQALLHGDLHSGSVFVTETSTKVIDPEFAFYGPMSFDIGSVIGNLLLNFAGQIGLEGDTEEKRAYQMYLLDTIEALWHTFEANFLENVKSKCQDPVFNAPGFAQAFIGHVWHESLGYAGTEIIRRTIGLAHVADLDSIEDEQIRSVSEGLALSVGVTLIKQRHEIRSPQVLRAVIQAAE